MNWTTIYLFAGEMMIWNSFRQFIFIMQYVELFYISRNKLNRNHEIIIFFLSVLA